MMKVKPKKVEYAFCPTCGKSVKFIMDWEGVAQMTSKGIITYRELYAVCPECDEEVYVLAINDVNVYRREKAYAEKVPESVQIPIAGGGKALAEALKNADVNMYDHWVICKDCIMRNECNMTESRDGCLAGEEEEYEV